MASAASSRSRASATTISNAPCRAHLRRVVPRLHPQQQIHAEAERLLDPERHLGRQRGVAVHQVGKRRTAPAENPRRRRHARPELLQRLDPDEGSGMREGHPRLDAAAGHRWVSSRLTRGRTESAAGYRLPGRPSPGFASMAALARSPDAPLPIASSSSARPAPPG